jgi:hypothetical protein
MTLDNLIVLPDHSSDGFRGEGYNPQVAKPPSSNFHDSPIVQPICVY